MSSHNLKNIVCEKPGSTNNTIMISAHYDSRMEDINNTTARTPGADDNASGVSALLEVARILSKVEDADYLPFEALGYTVIGFHDDGVTKNPNYHKSTDTPDTLEYQYIASVTKLLLATILNLDKLVTANNLDALSVLMQCCSIH
jgi:hypothetical protein